MAKKLIVKTDVGTFTRSTARTYTHIVVAAGVRHELLEVERLGAISHERRQAAKYDAIIAGTRSEVRTDRGASVEAFDRKFEQEHIADGSFAQWAAECRQRVATLEAQGPVTEDAGADFGLLGWCGRLDLALKLASATGTSAYASAGRFRHVRVYAIDGTRVR